MIVGNFMLFIDGVLVVLFGNEDWVVQYNFELFVYLVDFEIVVVDFIYGGDGLFMVLIYVVFCLFECNGFSLQDFDFYEVYEVFVFQVLVMLIVWEDEIYCCECFGLFGVFGFIDCIKFNVKGFFLVVGYLFVVIGICILVIIVKILEENGGGCVLIFICVAGGQGVVVIVEYQNINEIICLNFLIN